MARKSKLQTDEKIVEKKKGTRLFQEVLLWTLIPLLFTTMVLLIIAYVADVNVFDKAKEVDPVSHLLQMISNPMTKMKMT